MDFLSTCMKCDWHRTAALLGNANVSESQQKQARLSTQWTGREEATRHRWKQQASATKNKKAKQDNSKQKKAKQNEARQARRKKTQETKDMAPETKTCIFRIGARAHPDLNQGPADLQSAALTTELCTQLRYAEICKLICAREVNCPPLFCPFTFLRNLRRRKLHSHSRQRGDSNPCGQSPMDF